MLKLFERAVENARLRQSLAEILYHLNLSCVGARGVVTYRPEAVGSSPVIILLTQSLLAPCLDILFVVLIKRVGILIVKSAVD